MNLSPLNTSTTVQDVPILELVRSYGFEKKYLPGDPIILKDTPIHSTGILTEGLLKAHLDEEDNSSLLYHICTNCNPVLCLLDISNINAAPISITAIEDSKVLWIPNERIDIVEKEYTGFKRLKIKTTSVNINKITRTISNRLLLSLEERLLYYLEEKHRIYDTKTLSTPKSEIAIDLKSPLPSISRALKQLENRKRLIVRARSIQLL